VAIDNTNSRVEAIGMQFAADGYGNAPSLPARAGVHAVVIFILQRMMQSIAVLLAVSIAVFLAVYAVGDPVELLINQEATQVQREAMMARLGLDQPVWMQYLKFIWNALHGDLGTSFVHGEPALRLIVSRMPATFELVFLALLLASLIAIPLGLYVGLHEDMPMGRAIMTASILGYSIPSFWKGMVLILLFSVWLHWLPSSGR
jgi:peptide/nickel transport system permease protein